MNQILTKAQQEMAETGMKLAGQHSRLDSPGRTAYKRFQRARHRARPEATMTSSFFGRVTWKFATPGARQNAESTQSCAQYIAGLMASSSYLELMKAPGVRSMQAQLALYSLARDPHVLSRSLKYGTAHLALRYHLEEHAFALIEIRQSARCRDSGKQRYSIAREEVGSTLQRQIAPASTWSSAKHIYRSTAGLALLRV